MAGDLLAEAWVAIRPRLDDFGDELEAGLTSQVEKASKPAGEVLTHTLTPAALALAAPLGLIAGQVNEARSSIVAATGATGDALNALVDDARRVASSGVSTGIGEIGAVIGELASRTNLAGPGLDALATKVVKLAEVTGGDASDSVDGIIDLFKKWKVPTDAQSASLDLLFRASTRAGIPIDQLMASITTAGPTLQRFGFSLDEAAALIAEVERNGGNADKVLSALNLAFNKLATTSDDPVRAFRDLSTEIKQAATDGEAFRIAADALGTRAGPVLASAIRSGAFSVKDLSAALLTGTANIEEAHAATRTLTDRFSELTNKVAAFVAPAANTAAVIATIASGIGPTVQGLTAMTKALGLAGASGAPIVALRVLFLNLAEGIKAAITASLEFIATPVGATLAVVAIAVGALAFAWTRSAAAAREHNAAVQELSDQLKTGQSDVSQYEARISTLADAIDRTNSNVAPLTAATKANAIAQAAAANKTADLREQQDRYREAIENGKQAVLDQVAVTEVHTGALSQNKQEIIGNLVEEGRLQKALNLLTEWEGNAADAGRDLAQTHKAAADAARQQRLEELALTDSFIGIAADALHLADAQKELGQAEAKVTRLTERGKEGTVAFRNALRARTDASISALQAQDGLTQSVLSFADSQKDAGRSTRSIVEDVKSQARQAGLTRGEIGRLIDKVHDAIGANRGFGDSAKDGANTAAREFGAIPGKIGDLSGQMRDLGLGMSIGLASGINSGQSAVISAAINTAGVAVQAARATLGISSPSKVFAEMGRQSAEGFAQGIRDNQAEPVAEVDALLRKIGARAAARTAEARGRRPVGAEGPIRMAPFDPAVFAAAVRDAVVEVARQFGGLSPVTVQGDLIDYTRAEVKVERAREKRSVLLGGRRNR